MLGYSPADVARRSLNYRAITAPESAERDGKAKQERLERGASALYEKAYLRRDGSRVPALVGAAALDQSREDSWIEFVVDLTERKKLEQQFLEAQKLESLGLLAGGIAHDYNNLLTGIMGSASLLLYKTPPESSDAQLLGTVIEASERAAELTRQILAYSGKGRFITRRFVVSEAIQQIGDLLHSSLPPGVSLLMDLDPKLPQVNGDWNQIQQIVTNLVTNSVEAIESKSGEVRVSTGVKRIGPGANPDVAAGAYVFIEVRDSGRGIDAETRAKMFDPFFSTKFIGRGLGLAAVSGIVRGHRGFIETESAPGQGATLRVFLPVAD
jgi:PAS domain S-box-containing protein